MGKAMAADGRPAAITRRSLLLEGAILLALLLSSFTATVALSDPTGESNCSIYIKEERVCVDNDGYRNCLRVHNTHIVGLNSNICLVHGPIDLRACTGIYIGYNIFLTLDPPRLTYTLIGMRHGDRGDFYSESIIRQSCHTARLNGAH